MNAKERIRILKSIYPGKELVELMADALNQRGQREISLRFCSTLRSQSTTFSDRLLIWDLSRKGRLYHKEKHEIEALRLQTRNI
jgi:hypothetical protein